MNCFHMYELFPYALTGIQVSVFECSILTKTVLSIVALEGVAERLNWLRTWPLQTSPRFQKFVEIEFPMLPVEAD